MSSRLWLALPRFLWRGKWFWGAWLLIFSLPQTRHEARLHFLGSRWVPRLYGQPWQERWAGDKIELGSPDMTPLEHELWSAQIQGSGLGLGGYGFGSGSPNDPAKSRLGSLSRRFPGELWLRALAVWNSLGYGSFASRGAGATQAHALLVWAQRAMKIDPGNAFYPLVIAKAMGDSNRPAEREAMLQRAATCARFDDGSARLKRVIWAAACKAGVSTWTEQNEFFKQTSNSSYYGNIAFGNLAAQLAAMSVKDTGKGRVQAALKRSRAMMRVSLLMQSAPCGWEEWSTGENWARFAWSVSPTRSTTRPISRRGTITISKPTVFLADFEPFARQNGDAQGIVLARGCAARIQLISSFRGTDTRLTSEISNSLVAPRSPWGFFWSQGAHACGYCVLFFGLYLLGWWCLASAFNWRAVGRESSSLARSLPAVATIALSLIGLLALYRWFYRAFNAPWAARSTPPISQVEVLAAIAGLCFFAPPLLLALWCAVRTRWQNRAALAMPARQQIEMRLSPLEGWLLGQATGAFFAAFLLLSLAFAGLWAYFSWNALTGYDWLRAVAPGVSPRLVDPIFTSLERPTLPIYSALCLFPLTFVWLAAWRYVVGQERRAAFHSGIRAWKETLGSALTVTAWVYLALMLGCHFTGESFKARLAIVATQGEGALIPGWSAPHK